MSLGNIRYELDQAFLRFPYLMKRNLVDVVQFHELFTRFGLFPTLDTVGESERREWQNLVRLYTDAAHSYIDIQRRVQGHVKDLTGVDITPQKTHLVETLSPDTKIIVELRNRLHHVEIGDVAAIAMVGGGGVSYPAIPVVSLQASWFSDDVTAERATAVATDPTLLPQLFANHCSDFVRVSKDLFILLFQAVDDLKPQKQE